MTIEWRPVNGYRLATRVEKDEPLVRAMMKGVRQATGKAERRTLPCRCAVTGNSFVIVFERIHPGKLENGVAAFPTPSSCE